MSRNGNVDTFVPIAPEDEPVYDAGAPTPIHKKLLSRADIFANPIQLKTQEIEVPEWGGTLRVRELTAGERTAYSKRVTKTGPNGNTVPLNDIALGQAILISMTAVDENMERIFEEADLEKLRKQPARILDFVSETAQKLSGFYKKDDSGADDLKKIPDDDSRSA